MTPRSRMFAVAMTLKPLRAKSARVVVQLWDGPDAITEDQQQNVLHFQRTARQFLEAHDLA
ncbi:MAG: hypothetical protein ACRELF_07885, partial [Gemmataceae bacterium]